MTLLEWIGAGLLAWVAFVLALMVPYTIWFAWSWRRAKREIEERRKRMRKGQSWSK